MNANVRRLIVVVIIFILFIFGFVWIIRSVTGGNDEKAPTVAQTELVDYANTDTVSKFVVSGRILGDDEYGEVRISVGRNSRVLEVVRGYEGEVIRTESFRNNESAYRVFLSSLHNAGFTKNRAVNNAVLAEGSCPTGRRFWYQIANGDEFKQSLWSTSCSGVRGTFAGRADTVRWLFEKQIPDFDDRTENVDL